MEDKIYNLGFSIQYCGAAGKHLALSLDIGRVSGLCTGRF